MATDRENRTIRRDGKKHKLASMLISALDDAEARAISGAVTLTIDLCMGGVRGQKMQIIENISGMVDVKK
jgi:hypothetical protein